MAKLKFVKRNNSIRTTMDWPHKILAAIKLRPSACLLLPMLHLLFRISTVHGEKESESDEIGQEEQIYRFAHQVQM